ncbi:hypothetical protein LB504_005370 [Fusarium proliferatum]|nr:hypothetical protein LB504_005370 [Fusarium proliferatum]
MVSNLHEVEIAGDLDETTADLRAESHDIGRPRIQCFSRPNVTYMVAQINTGATRMSMSCNMNGLGELGS